MGRKKRNGVPGKPSGDLSALELGGGKPASIHKVGFPRAKREIERQILKTAISVSPHLADHYRLVNKPRQNDENDFDFTLETTSGEEFLDLQEAAPLNKLGGSYEAVPREYSIGERADMVWEEVARKAAKYGASRRPGIHLMLYVTDWRLSLDPEALELLAFYASERPHGFTSIVYFQPEPDHSGQVVVMYPRQAAEFVDFDEDSRRAKRMISIDLRDYRELPEGGVAIHPRLTGPVDGFIIDARQV